MEQVRVTSPDLVQRAAVEKARGRMLIAALLFAGCMVVLVLRLTYATIIHPILPTPAVLAAMQPELDDDAAAAGPRRYHRPQWHDSRGVAARARSFMPIRGR